MKPKTVSIKKALPADAPQLTPIAFAAKRHWQYPEEWIQLWAEDLTITPDYILQNQVFVATLDDKIIAFTALAEQERDYEIEHLWVLPNHMGLGIGQQLIKHLQKIWSKPSPHSKRTIVVSDPHALGFYEKMGATLIGEFESTPKGRTLPILEFKK